jgi:HTH-type transcriptional regulator/antitoxin HigA
MEDLKYTVIANKKQYKIYCTIVDKLMDLDETNNVQEEEIKLLTVLIEKWDAEHSTYKDLDPIEIIRSLAKDHNLNSAELLKIMGISKSYLSEILNYKKGLSKEVIRKLASHFKMNQAAFNRPYALKFIGESKRVKLARNNSSRTMKKTRGKAL